MGGGHQAKCLDGFLEGVRSSLAGRTHFVFALGQLTGLKEPRGSGPCADGAREFNRISLRQESRVLPEGKDSVRIYMGQRDWEVRTEITATDHPWMRRVEVDVFELQAGERVGPFDHSVAFVGRY